MRRLMLAFLAAFAFLGPAARSAVDGPDDPRFGPPDLPRDKHSFVPANPVNLDLVKEDAAALRDSTTSNRRRS